MGYAIASVLGRQGDCIILCDIHEEALNTVSATLTRQNMDVHYCVVDVSKRDQVEFLCSCRASYISGIDILMDNGIQAFSTAPQFPD